MFLEKVHEQKLAQRKRMPCHTNRASSLGEECLRYLCYERVAWEKKELPDLRLQQRFDEGNEQERIVIKNLVAAGIEIYEQQTAVQWKEFEITGHMDGIVYYEEEGKKKAAVLEVKSCVPGIFDQVNEPSDFQKYFWMKKYIAQIQVYMMFRQVEKACLILKSLDGRDKEFWFDLDYGFVENLLQKATKINEHVAKWELAKDEQAKEETLPARITDNAKKCLDCPYFAICTPPVKFDGMEVLDSQALQLLLDERESLAASSSKYTRINEEIRDRLGDREMVMVGNWMIEGKRDSRGAMRRSYERIEKK